MQRIRSPEFWRPAAVGLAGGIALVATGLICFWAQSGVATAGFALLIVVTLLSLLGNFWMAAVLSCIAVVCLNYLFVPPRFSLRMERVVDLMGLVAFLTASVTVTGLSARARRLAEQKLEQTRSDLARFARVASLGELTASIAHEVNQPLAGVVSSGNACQRWLASDPPNLERATQSLERVIRDANRASQVVERVRNLARNAPPNKAVVDVNDAVREIIALARTEVEQHAIALRTGFSSDLPPVWADRIQLQQVILNLVVNAIEALGETGDRPRDLFVGTETDGTAEEVVLTVRDTGSGLDAEHAQRIFDPFYTTKHDGMGMGLAVSRGIIEAHGGRLWATPNEPLGAVFRCALPIYHGRAA